MPVTAETLSEAPPAGGSDERTATGSQERSSVATPERSLDQRKQALDLANEVRTQRADLKRELKASRVTIQSLVLNPPQYLLTAKVYDIILAVPKYGRVKTNRVLKHCRVSPSKTFGGLSKRQRDEIVAYLSR